MSIFKLLVVSAALSFPSLFAQTDPSCPNKFYLDKDQFIHLDEWGLHIELPYSKLWITWKDINSVGKYGTTGPYSLQVDGKNIAIKLLRQKYEFAATNPKNGERVHIGSLYAPAPDSKKNRAMMSDLGKDAKFFTENILFSVYEIKYFTKGVETPTVDYVEINSIHKGKDLTDEANCGAKVYEDEALQKPKN